MKNSKSYANPIVHIKKNRRELMRALPDSLKQHTCPNGKDADHLMHSIQSEIGSQIVLCGFEDCAMRHKEGYCVLKSGLALIVNL